MQLMSASGLHPQIAAGLAEDPPPPSPLEASPSTLRAWFRTLASTQGRAEDVHSVEDGRLPGPRGPVGVRIYRPHADGPVPTVVALHGGWFALGDIEILDRPSRTLANAAGAVVVSVDYALAPEHPYPAGLDDAVAVIRHVHRDIAEFGGDPARLFVVGESAGATLAAGAAIRLRDAGDVTLAGQLLVYPTTDQHLDSPSWDELDGIALVREWGRHYWRQYLRDATPDMASLATLPPAGELHGLPPAHVFTAEFDPLRDEGEAYGSRLAEAGIPAHTRRYLGMAHGMLYHAGLTPDARVLTDDLASVIRGGQLQPRTGAVDL
jgi:acetyl esterase